MSKSITRNDIKEIVTEVIRENNTILKKEFNNVYTILAQHDKRFDHLDQKIDDLRNEWDQFKDDMSGVLSDMRDEIAILVGYKDDIEDHGVRIDKLEQKVFPGKN